MAKLSSIAKNNKRREVALKWAPIRKKLRKQAVDVNATEEEREAARLKLNKLPRNTSLARVRNRCYVTGRPRGYLRKFGLCRVTFREMAHEGKIPGVTKASW